MGVDSTGDVRIDRLGKQDRLRDERAVVRGEEDGRMKDRQAGVTLDTYEEI